VSKASLGPWPNKGNLMMFAAITLPECVNQARSRADVETAHPEDLPRSRVQMHSDG
jgi:hypothetical protein